MKMREKMARAIEPQSWKMRKLAGDSLAYKNRRTSSLRKADAILDALYEPTEEMLAGFGIHKGRMRLNWQAMIAQAKAER